MEAVRLLADAVPARIALAANRGDPAELIEAWTGADLAVVIDAAASGAPPGTIHRYRETLTAPGSTVPESTKQGSTAPESRLGLPHELVVYGIEGADFSIGATMTPIVARAARRVAALVMGRVTSSGRPPEGPLSPT